MPTRTPRRENAEVRSKATAGKGQREGPPTHTQALRADTQAQTHCQGEFCWHHCKDWQTQQRTGFQDYFFLLREVSLSCASPVPPVSSSVSAPHYGLILFLRNTVFFIQQLLLELCYSNMKLTSTPLEYPQARYNPVIPLLWQCRRGAEDSSEPLWAATLSAWRH